MLKTDPQMGLFEQQAGGFEPGQGKERKVWRRKKKSYYHAVKGTNMVVLPDGNGERPRALEALAP